ALGRLPRAVGFPTDRRRRGRRSPAVGAGAADAAGTVQGALSGRRRHRELLSVAGVAVAGGARAADRPAALRRPATARGRAGRGPHRGAGGQAPAATAHPPPARRQADARATTAARPAVLWRRAGRGRLPRTARRHEGPADSGLAPGAAAAPGDAADAAIRLLWRSPTLSPPPPAPSPRTTPR